MDRLIEKHRIAVRERNLELKKGKDKYHLQKGDYVSLEKVNIKEYEELFKVIIRASHFDLSDVSGRQGWKYIGIDGTGGLRHWNLPTAYGSTGTERTPEYILGATPKEEI